MKYFSFLFLLFIMACSGENSSEINEKQYVKFPKHNGGEIYTIPFTQDRLNHVKDKNPIVVIKNNGSFVCSADGNSGMMCNQKEVGIFELFELDPQEGGIITLLGSNLKYVSSNNGKSPMRCDRSAAKEWERFKFIHKSENIYVLQANNGKYVSSENGLAPMSCNRLEPKEWESFEIYEIVPHEVDD